MSEIKHEGKCTAYSVKLTMTNICSASFNFKISHFSLFEWKFPKPEASPIIQTAVGSPGKGG